MPDSVKPLLTKLGVKDGLKTAVLGFIDREFMLEQPYDLSLRESETYDLVLFQAGRVEDLRLVHQIKWGLALRGALWIVYPKGVKEITQRQVMFAGNADGFTDCKVCSFSPTHTALKFVRRRS